MIVGVFLNTFSFAQFFIILHCLTFYYCINIRTNAKPSHCGQCCTILLYCIIIYVYRYVQEPIFKMFIETQFYVECFNTKRCGIHGTDIHSQCKGLMVKKIKFKSNCCFLIKCMMYLLLTDINHTVCVPT